MKKLNIPCPFCGVDNQLTVFQAGKDTLFKVNCNSCAREFQIDSFGNILGFRRDAIPGDYEKEHYPPPKSFKKGYGGVPVTQQREDKSEIQDIIQEIEEAEMDQEKKIPPEEMETIPKTREMEEANGKRKGSGAEIPGEQRKRYKPPSMVTPVKKRYPDQDKEGVVKGREGRDLDQEQKEDMERAPPSRRPPYRPSEEVSIPRKKDAARRIPEQQPPLPSKGIPRPPSPSRGIPQPPSPSKGIPHPPSPSRGIPHQPPPYPHSRTPIHPHPGNIPPGYPPYMSPQPFIYPFFRVPFSRNPDWASRLLLTSAIIGFLTAILIVYVVSTVLDGDYHGITIEGKVMDEMGNPIKDAEIFAVDENITTTTDSQGRYSITDLDSGTHTFHINASGFRLLKYSVTFWPEGFSQDFDVQKDFVLKNITADGPTEETIDESIEEDIYFFPTLIVIASTISFLGGLAARKRILWSFCIASSIIGIFSFGLVIVSPILSVIALVIILRTRYAFRSTKNVPGKPPQMRENDGNP